MRACIQRVARASVTVDGQVVGQIGKGLLILLGIAQEDTQEEAIKLGEKIIGLRIFEDSAGKMNLALADVGGAVLVVSQFTLYADCRKGRRPSFVGAAPPDKAEELYQFFCHYLRTKGVPVSTGRFREHMLVELVNDGPVTIWLDSREL